jgi:hypothetical protein
VSAGTAVRRSSNASRLFSFSAFRATSLGVVLAAATAGVAVVTAVPAGAMPMPKMFGARSDYFAGYKLVPSASSVAATFTVPTLHCDKTPDTAVVPQVQLTTDRTASSAGVVLACNGTQASYALQVSVNGTLNGPAVRATKIRTPKVVRAGDVVTVRVATKGKKVTASVRVLGRGKFLNVTSKLVGTPVGNDILVNGVGSRTAPLNVPDFGVLTFANVSLGGQSMDAADSGVLYDRTPAGRTVQITVSQPSADARSFTATFVSSAGNPV